MSATQTTPRNAVGAYWFIDDAAAADLPAARARVREIAQQGFTELWVAVRDLRGIGDASSPLVCAAYRAVLEVVVEETDHAGLGLVPFIIPCMFYGLEAARLSQLLCGVGEPSGGQAVVDLGVVAPAWVDQLTPHAVRTYATTRTAAGVSVVPGTVRDFDTATVSLQLDGDRLLAAVDACPDADEVFVAVLRHDEVSGPTDITTEAFRRRLAEVVAFHEDVCGGHPSYIGLAFDEPNINDPIGLGDDRRARAQRFWYSESVADLLASNGHDLRGDLHLLVRPDAERGMALRFAFYEGLQDALMETLGKAMVEASVPLLGTHDWSGDRDRALYYTFDQLEFAGVRSYGATDISGFQNADDYACGEALLAYAQRVGLGLERAMIMTDHFREVVDETWLTYTCERHAALGVDYMLVHAYGAITGDPPLWTRTESWPVYREPFALEHYTARMKSLAVLRDYTYDADVLVVYPRWGRLTNPGDRWVVREWTHAMLALHRAHRSPVSISQRRLRDVVFDGGTATIAGQTVTTIVLPYLTTLAEDDLERLLAFHAAGGHVVITKPNDLFLRDDGRPAPELYARLLGALGVSGAPTVRRIAEGEQLRVDGHTYTAHRLPDGSTEYDDCALDLDGSPVVTAVSPAGGRATLVGFELAALSCAGTDLHRMDSHQGVELLDRLLAPAVERTFSVRRHGSADEDLLTVGLLRRRGGEQLLSLHRNHADAVVVQAGRAVVHVPAGAAPHELAAGVNVFVPHVEDDVVVVANPLPTTLRTADLGAPIRNITGISGERHCLFEGSTVGVAVPPGRDVRFASVEFGEREPRLPQRIRADVGDVLSATQAGGDDAVTTLRVTGPGEVRVRLSLAAELGGCVTATCPTSGQEATVSVAPAGDRLDVTVDVAIVRSLENDVVIRQG